MPFLIVFDEHSVGGSEKQKLRPTRNRDKGMSEIHRTRKRLVPVDYNAMVIWLENKGRPVSIENLGGGGPHSYEAKDGTIVIDGWNKVTEGQWKRTCIAMVREIPAERLDVTTEYIQQIDFSNPSIPVLCWALCEELMNNNQVWN